MNQLVLPYCILTSGICFLLFRYRANALSPDVFALIVNVAAVTLGLAGFVGEERGISVVFADGFDYLLEFSAMVLWLNVALLIGAIAGREISFSSDPLERESASLWLQDHDLTRVLGSNGPAYIALASLLTYIVGNGISDLVWRTGYMVENIKFMKSLGTVACLAASFVLGYSSRDGFGRWQGKAFLFLFVIVFVFLGYSSRGAAIAVVIFGGALLMAKIDRWSLLVFSVLTAFAPFLLHASLFMRGEQEQGMIPLIVQSFSGEFWREFDVEFLVQNSFTGSLLIAAMTAKVAAIDTSYILTSLNPLPGVLTDWYSLESDINTSTPYVFSGEWVAYGIWRSMPFFLLYGSVLAFVGTRAATSPYIYGLIGVALCNLAALAFLQYNTRSGFRYIVYFFAIVGIVAIFRKIKGSRAG